MLQLIECFDKLGFENEKLVSQPECSSDLNSIEKSFKYRQKSTFLSKNELWEVISVVLWIHYFWRNFEYNFHEY